MTKKMGVLFLKRGLKVYEDLFSLLKKKNQALLSQFTIFPGLWFCK